MKLGGRGVLAVLAVGVMATSACDQAAGEDPRGNPTQSAPVSSTAQSSAANPAPPMPTTSFQPADREFDHAAMQDAVHQVLTEYHQIEMLGTVICPSRRPVKEGLKFHCTAVIAGDQKKVPITVTSDDGDYQVGAPR